MSVIGTSKWTCPECAYSNWASSTICVLCSTQKPKDIFPKSPTGKFRSLAHVQTTLAWPKAASASAVRSHGPSGATYSPQIICPASNYPSSAHNSRNLSESSGKWVCSTCTYSNCPNTTQCAMCRHPRGRNFPVTATTGLQMESSHNPPVGKSILDYASYVGAVGGAAYSDDRLPSYNVRDSPTNPPKVKSGKNGNKTSSNMESRASRKWRCHRCTYENWPRATKCIMCQALRKRTPSPPRSEHRIPELHLPQPPSSSSLPTTAPDNSSPSHTHPRSHSQATSHSHSHSRSSSGGLNSNEAAATCSHSPKDSSASSPSSSTGSANSAAGSRLITCSVDPHEIPSAKLKSVSDEVRQIRNRLSSSDWLFLNACLGVVNGEEVPVKAYLRQDGDLARQLNKDECLVLGEPSKFSVGSTLVHLAVRFQRSELLSLLLTPATSEARKRLPSHSNPDLAASIREQAALCLRQHKGDWPCYFSTQLTTFTLPSDVRKFCSAVQKKLLDEIVDRDVQKELEVEPPIINWSGELLEELGSQLYPLWNRTAGDCLLDSVLQATWGVVDRDSTLRSALADSLVDGASRFYERWKEAEQRQSHAQGFSLDEEQLRQDWGAVVALADQKGKSLEQMHVFCLAHILRRPVAVYGVKIVKNFRGENLGFANFEGVYLPLLWESSFCWKSPVALAYTRGHFSALVSIAPTHPSIAGAWSNRSCERHVTYLPLVDCEGRLLPVHFLSEQEIGCEERLLNEYCECHVTRGGTLVAKQEVTDPQQPTLVVQLVDEWLDRFRRMDKRREAASCTVSYDSDS